LGYAYYEVGTVTEPAFNVLLTIANPSANNFIEDCYVFINLDKATTGFGSGYTTETIQFSVARKLDGTTYLLDGNSNGDGMTATITGTLASANRMMGIRIGPIGPAEDCQIWATLSAAQADFELPYIIYYRGPAPTITEVTGT
jgi:hypothetical protein